MSPFLLVDLVGTGGHLLVDHETKDAQHGGVAVVGLDGKLGEHGLPVEVVPVEVGVAIVGVVHACVEDCSDIFLRRRLEDDSG